MRCCARRGRRWSWLVGIAGVAALLSVAPPPAAGGTAWTFDELDVHGFDVVQARDIANGYVVGYGTIRVPGGTPGAVDQHAFAWPLDGGQRIDLSHGFRSYAISVDNAGHVSGAVYFTSIRQSNP